MYAGRKRHCAQGANALLVIMTVEGLPMGTSLRKLVSLISGIYVRHPLIADMVHGEEVSVPKVINLPKHYDFIELRRTPAEVRSTVQALDHTSNVVRVSDQKSHPPSP